MTHDRIHCRFCNQPLGHTLVDLGMSPLSNSYLETGDLSRPETFYPLHVYVCDSCWLTQLPEAVRPEAIFSDYAYFSSYSDSWLAHAKRYVEQMIDRFGIGKDSQVVEIASNDGYLLRWFKDRSVPVLGIEPARNVARVAEAAGIPTRSEFFGETCARQLVADNLAADLLLGNNVLAHVPNINDFITGLAVALKPTGIVTMEFPHLLRLMEQNQFDTIYHEHYSYLSLTTVARMFAAHNLVVFDVDEIDTHGGSLRIYAQHEANASRPVDERIVQLLRREAQEGLTGLPRYADFTNQVMATKRQLLSFLIEAKAAGKSIVGYGAPAKGNTLLNYCGIREDFLDYTVDRSPHKQGRYLPGTRIPIYAPDRLFSTRPDYVLILPWNIRDEVMEQMSAVFDWGGKFVVAIPEVRVYDHR